VLGPRTEIEAVGNDYDNENAMETIRECEQDELRGDVAQMHNEKPMDRTADVLAEGSRYVIPDKDRLWRSRHGH
jgi:hypothetical protein